jgi:diguanylate cyclase (GGDEF)-like protein/PAS domain S-box-containing protein
MNTPIFNKLLIQFPLIFLGFALTLVILFFLVLEFVGKPLLQEQAYKQVSQVGHTIIKDLENRIVVGKTLAVAMANAAESIPKTELSHKQIIPHILNYTGTENFIAGGGIWPEPFKFDPLLERRSFFWGRTDMDPELKYFDDYNDPSGMGYHNEEWYVPAMYNNDEEAFWSKSYMDPYSYQPMVTVTIPMFRDGKRYGVSTVDIKLDGLNEFMNNMSKKFGGYAFIVDRNGKFLSFPDKEKAQVISIDSNNNKSEEYIYINELGIKEPLFNPISERIRSNNKQIIELAKTSTLFDNNLAKQIDHGSYQIDLVEAELIAAIKTNPLKETADNSLEIERFDLEKDLFFNEPVTVSIFHMPDTYWKIVTVMPVSLVTATVSEISSIMFYSTIIIVFIGMLILAVLVHRKITSPLNTITKKLQDASIQGSESVEEFIDYKFKGELKVLVHWLNKRSSQLNGALKKLKTEINEREATEKVLTEREEMLTAIYDSAYDGIFIIDENNIIININSYAAKMLGYEKEELIGIDCDVLHRNEKEAFNNFLNHVLKKERYHTDGLTCITKSGSKLPVAISGSLIKQNESEYVMAIVRDMSEQKKAKQEIEQLAYYDVLTNLPNRRLLVDRLNYELAVVERRMCNGALLFLDLDNFKTLNDSLGHTIGDQFLVQVSKRIVDSIREVDTAARLGGDEFVVLLSDLSIDRNSAKREVQTIAKKLQVVLSKPYYINGYEHHAGASIGVVLFPEHGDNTEDLLKNADTAMYLAKSDGRNTVRFYKYAMQEEANARLVLERDLRVSLNSDEFSLHLQPQIDQNEGTISAEALLRWQHPVRGMIPPNVFIPVAEDTGMICELGDWVLKEACKIIKEIQDTNLPIQHISVNVSPRQFYQPDYVDQTLRVIEEFSVDPKKLVLEITEGVFVKDISNTVKKMNLLKSQGVRFSIDDFGVGHSSLSYLRRLPLDQLKIDKSFVDEISNKENDLSIVKTIISMAKTLNLHVIAEGVEIEDQLNILQKNGCNAFQGYYFSKPITKDEFFAYVNDNIYSKQQFKKAL